MELESIPWCTNGNHGIFRFDNIVLDCIYQKNFLVGLHIFLQVPSNMPVVYNNSHILHMGKESVVEQHILLVLYILDKQHTSENKPKEEQWKTWKEQKNASLADLFGFFENHPVKTALVFKKSETEYPEGKNKNNVEKVPVIQQNWTQNGTKS